MEEFKYNDTNCTKMTCQEFRDRYPNRSDTYRTWANGVWTVAEVATTEIHCFYCGADVVDVVYLLGVDTALCQACAEKRILSFVPIPHVRTQLFKDECTRIAKSLSIVVMFFPDLNDRDLFVNEGVLCIARSGIRACFVIPDSQNPSSYQYNANIMGVLTRLDTPQEIINNWLIKG